jgi:4-hydroxy-tetrahydrodipicolinate reductase
MKIALIGYGKMGKAIEAIAISKGHEIVLKIDLANKQEFTQAALSKADVAIEFTGPHSAFENVKKCIELGIPVVSGSTGWLEKWSEIELACKQHKGCVVYSSNYSIGVNLFFELNAILAKMMNTYPEYQLSIEETHHTHKKDAPSGTAITLAERIIDQLARKKSWTLAQPIDANQLSITAHRIDEVPGTHVVKYTSSIDDIELKHTAHNRDGFALGAIVAAEFLQSRKGIFSMKDVLGM